MSSMLEEAIIDATALKEAAIKNAENVIVEKYSADIKEAVESLLEGEEDMGAEEEQEAPQAQEEIPVGAMPDSDTGEEEMVINFEELRKIADAIEEKEEQTGQDLMGEPQSQETLASMIGSQGPEGAPAPSLDPPDAPMPTSVTMALEEEVDLEEVLDIMEELVVDIHPQKGGWAATPDDVMNYKAEMFLAQKASTSAQEELKIQRELVKRLTLENKTYKQANIKYKKLIIEANSRIEKSNLTNARLLYTNRVMTNDSLNERQKTKIVEALSKTSTVEEAKIIYDTLQSTVGTGNKPGPKSLREAVTRSSSATLSRRNDKTTISNPVSSRWKTLAGIKDNN